jgi:hypothetical protein
MHHNHNANPRSVLSLLAEGTQFLVHVLRFRCYWKIFAHEIIHNHLTTLTPVHTGMEDSTAYSVRRLSSGHATGSIYMKGGKPHWCTIYRLADLHVTTYPSSTKGPFFENSFFFSLKALFCATIKIIRQETSSIAVLKHFTNYVHSIHETKYFTVSQQQKFYKI